MNALFAKSSSFQKVLCNKIWKDSLIRKRFITKFDLDSHLVAHTKERPIKCDLFVSRFGVKTDLASQKKLYSGEKFQCDVCDSRLDTKNGLKKHMRTHKGDTPFACTIFAKAVSSSNSWPVTLNYIGRRSTGVNIEKGSSLRKLLGSRVHTGDTPYECLVCGRNLPTKQNLQMHQEQMHSGSTFA